MFITYIGVIEGDTTYVNVYNVYYGWNIQLTCSEIKINFYLGQLPHYDYSIGGDTIYYVKGYNMMYYG